MNYEQARDALPYVCFAFAGVCLAIGYVAGVKRGFAALGYGSETMRQILATLRPCFGRRWSVFYHEKTPLDSLLVFLRLKSLRA